MSGGFFSYNQYKIGQIAEDIQQTIDKNGLKLDEDLIKENKKWHGDDYYERFPEELYHYKYPDNVIEKFKEAVDILKKAEIYAQRIDWLLSGDDGEQSFFTRLEEDLKQIENKMYTEEEVYELLLKHQSAYRSAVRNTSPLDWSFDVKQWFEQFKKK